MMVMVEQCGLVNKKPSSLPYPLSLHVIIICRWDLCYGLRAWLLYKQYYMWYLSDVLVVYCLFSLKAQSSTEVVVSSPHQTTSTGPRHSPDSGVAMSTDSSSFSPQSLIEKKRSSSLSELSVPAVTIADERPNSANAVLDKVPTSASNDATGTVPLNHDPPKPALSVNNLSHPPPPLGQVAYNSSYYPGYANYNAYSVSSGLSSTAVYSPAYSGYSTTPSAGSHYYPQTGSSGSGLYTSNCYYVPQRNAPNSYVPLTYYPTTQSSSSSLPFAEIPSSSSMASTNSRTEPLACIRSSPTKPLSSSQSLPDDEAHMSPDSSSVHHMGGFPVVSLSGHTSSSTDSETGGDRDSCSDKELSDENGIRR